MICRNTCVLLVFLFGLVTLSPVPGLAADEQKASAGREYRAAAAEEWNLQLSVDHLLSASLHGTPGDAGISDYRLKLARTVKLNESLNLTLGGGYGLKHIDVSSPASLPRDLHALFVEAGARYRINDSSFASVKLFPGFYSDFKDLGTDDLRMPLLALGGYNFESGVSVIGGFIYRFGYHASRFIPALGISYQPDQYWRFDLVAPRPGITYFASRQLQLLLSGDFASDEYEITDRSLGAKAIKYSDFKVMAGVNYLPLPSVKISTSVGYAFDRKFAFFDGNRPGMRVDDAPFFKLACDVGW